MALTVAMTAIAAQKFVIALPNGYEMARVKSGAPAISKRRGSVVVPGPIKAYAVLRDVVVGELDVPQPKDASVASAAAAVPAASAAPPASAAPAQGADASQAASAAPASASTSQGGPQNAGAAPAPAASGGGAQGGAKPAADKPANPVFTRPPPSPNGRYFVLDTKTGEVGKDLSLTEWEERLKRFDITSPPQLAEPILPK
jgi:hypothetical protein